MSRILVIYESLYGQTEKIAEYVSDVARYRGHTTSVVTADRASQLPIANHDAAAIFAPVYYSRHPRTIETYVRRNADLLAQRPCMFVSVSGSAASAEQTIRQEADRIAHAFVERTGIRPQIVATVAGAMSYPRYGFFLRNVLRFISWRAGAPTDTSRVHELTDWSVVDDVASRFLDLLDVPRVTDESGAHPIPGRSPFDAVHRS
jgi:menaquinone-dependent protoporphyrinogen oxidase